MKNKLITISLLAILILGWCLFLEEPAEKEIKIVPADIEEKIIIQGNSYKATPHEELAKIEFWAVITAYSPVPEQTDEDPTIMASGKEVYENAIACPRWLEFGSRVKIDGKIYTCEDRTHPRLDGIFDILMFNNQKAIEFGRQKKLVEII